MAALTAVSISPPVTEMSVMAPFTRRRRFAVGGLPSAVSMSPLVLPGSASAPIVKPAIFVAPASETVTSCEPCSITSTTYRGSSMSMERLRNSSSCDSTRVAGSTRKTLMLKVLSGVGVL